MTRIYAALEQVLMELVHTRAESKCVADGYHVKASDTWIMSQSIRIVKLGEDLIQ